MSGRIFIDLYLDEDVDVLIARLLRARGFDAMTTPEAGMLGGSDTQQLNFATQAQRTLLTHNRVDFEQQIRERFAAERTHSGIIIATRQPPHEIVRRLLIVLDSTTADEIANQVRYI